MMWLMPVNVSSENEEGSVAVERWASFSLKRASGSFLRSSSKSTGVRLDRRWSIAIHPVERCEPDNAEKGKPALDPRSSQRFAWLIASLCLCLRACAAAVGNTHTTVQKAARAVKAVEGFSPTDGNAEISIPKGRQSVLIRAKMLNASWVPVLKSQNWKPTAWFEQCQVRSTPTLTYPVPF